MRKFVVNDKGEDEGSAFTAVAPTTPTRVIVGFHTTTITTAAAVATTTATITVAASGDDDSNKRSVAVYRPGNRAAAKSATFAGEEGKERKGSTAPLVAIVITAVAAAELSVHADCGSQAASGTG